MFNLVDLIYLNGMSQSTLVQVCQSSTRF